ncbi:MAG: hypothetical protein ABW005_03670 [Burkholderiaceae bacterium]
MKRLLISLATAACVLPVLAQTNANPAAKVDPKNNKVANPVVEKPKPKLMTRAELRACMDLSDANNKEAVEIKKAQADYKASSQQLLKEKAELLAADEALSKDKAAAQQEQADILKGAEDLKAAGPKMEKAEYEAKVKEHEARVAAFNAKINSLNERIQSGGPKRKDWSDRAEVVNASFKVLEARTEAQLDKVDDWKANCSKKAYDENDEIAIKKERAAAAK